MPSYNNPRKTWRYADDFKIRAVEMSYQVGVQIYQVSEGLDIPGWRASRVLFSGREGLWDERCNPAFGEDRCLIVSMSQHR